MRRQATVLAGLAALTSPWFAVPTYSQTPDSIPGVALGLLYEASRRPALAIAPFEGAPGAESLAVQAEGIVRRDLDYADRFQMGVVVPPALVALEELDYRLWDRLGVDYLLRGRVERAGDGFALYVEVHDIVYGRLLGVRRSTLPPPSDPAFRMAVHVISDAVVEQLFDEPGMAATRIAFSMRPAAGGSKDLYVVDSDGENLRRVSRHDISILSPSWHPSGERIAFASLLEGDPAVFEVNLRTGQERRIPSLGEGQVNTPAYLPGGERLAVALDRGFSSRVVTWDVERGCCPTVAWESRSQDLSPAYSSDGRWVAFTSNRLGPPLVFVQPAAGGGATLIAPYVFGQPADFTAPEWSPRGDLVAYHGRLGRGQQYQILVTEYRDGPGRTVRLTSEGSNEAPSWAPDGRHLVFVGERSNGVGLFVVDTATGRTRRLLVGRDLSTPAWSPTLTR